MTPATPSCHATSQPFASSFVQINMIPYSYSANHCSPDGDWFRSSDSKVRGNRSNGSEAGAREPIGIGTWPEQDIQVSWSNRNRSFIFFIKPSPRSGKVRGSSYELALDEHLRIDLIFTQRVSRLKLRFWFTSFSPPPCQLTISFHHC